MNPYRTRRSSLAARVRLYDPIHRIRTMALLAAIIGANWACRPSTGSDESKTTDARARDVAVHTEPRSPFELVRRTSTLAFRSSNLTVFITGSARDLETGLPGIGLGTDRGPQYGLLSGFFAPQMLAATSSASYALDVRAGQSDLHITLLDARDRAALTATFMPPREGRVRLITEGPITLTFAAARTTVRGIYEGLPSFSLEASAGDTPRRRYLRGQRIIVENPRLGSVIIEQSCQRATLIHPTPRGSTSVFLLRIGPDPGPIDLLYAPHDDTIMPEDRNDCTARTASISYSWPPAS